MSNAFVPSRRGSACFWFSIPLIVLRRACCCAAGTWTPSGAEPATRPTGSQPGLARDQAELDVRALSGRPIWGLPRPWIIGWNFTCFRTWDTRRPPITPRQRPGPAAVGRTPPSTAPLLRQQLTTRRGLPAPGWSYPRAVDHRPWRYTPPPRSGKSTRSGLCPTDAPIFRWFPGLAAGPALSSVQRSPSYEPPPCILTVVRPWSSVSSPMARRPVRSPPPSGRPLHLPSGPDTLAAVGLSGLLCIPPGAADWTANGALQLAGALPVMVTGHIGLDGTFTALSRRRADLRPGQQIHRCWTAMSPAAERLLTPPVPPGLLAPAQPPSCG